MRLIVLGKENKYFPYYLHKAFYKLNPSMAKTYLEWFSLINFAIVVLFGKVLSYVIVVSFSHIPVLGEAVASIGEIIWLWIMTVGAFGHLWGFPKIKREIMTPTSTSTETPEQESLVFIPQNNPEGKTEKTRKTTKKKVPRKKVKLPPFMINIMMLVFGLLMLVMSSWFTGFITLAFALTGVFLIIASVRGGILPTKTKKKEEKGA